SKPFFLANETTERRHSPAIFTPSETTPNTPIGRCQGKTLLICIGFNISQLLSVASPKTVVYVTMAWLPLKCMGFKYRVAHNGVMGFHREAFQGLALVCLHPSATLVGKIKIQRWQTKLHRWPCLDRDVICLASFHREIDTVQFHNPVIVSFKLSSKAF